MEVTYRRSFWDMVWFNFYQTPRTLTSQILFGIITLAIGYGVFTAFVDNLTDNKFPLWIYVLSYSILFILELLATFLIIAALIFLVLIFTYITSQSQRKQNRQECKLSVSENGLISETPIGRSEIKWSGIVKIHQSYRYVLLYFSERTALLIPKRAFVNKAEADDFFNYAYQFWDMAKKTSASD